MPVPQYLQNRTSPEGEVLVAASLPSGQVRVTVGRLASGAAATGVWGFVGLACRERQESEPSNTRAEKKVIGRNKQGRGRPERTLYARQTLPGRRTTDAVRTRPAGWS